MRKLIFLLLFTLLCPGASAAETEPPKLIALTFEGFPAGKMGDVLLAELAARDAHATFFLTADTLRASPGLGERMVAGGHEIGLPGAMGRNLSRREIAREITEFRALVPENARVRFLRLPEAQCSDGLRQVAQAMKLSFLDWSRDAEAAGVRGGAVIRIPLASGADLPVALDLLDSLKKRGFTLLTASELAARRQITLRPGRRYRDFTGNDR